MENSEYSLIQESINHFDLLVIIIYLLLSLIIGLFGSKLMGLSSTKEEDYYLAGRKMPGWLNGLSNAATALNSDVAPLYCGIAVVAGLSGAWFYLSRFCFGMLVVALLFVVKWRQLRIKTGPEFFSLRYGRISKLPRVYSSIHGILLGMIPWIGAGMVGMHKVAGPIFGYESIWITIGVIIPLLTIYVWSSGLAGVLITDGIQSFVIIIGNLVLVAAVLFYFGGPSGMGRAIHAAYDNNDAQSMKILVGDIAFYELKNQDGIRQIAIYPQKRSGYYSNTRNAEPVTTQINYTGKGTFQPPQRFVFDNGIVIEDRSFSIQDARPQTLNGRRPVAITTLSGLSYCGIPLLFADGQWQCGNPPQDNADYGDRLTSTLPVPGNRIVEPLGVLLWIIITVVGSGGSVGSDGQRYFSCKNNYEASKVGLWGNVALFGMLLFLMLPVLGMLAKYPELHFISSGGDRENIYGRMLTEFLPTGAVGITVAALLASVMSTVSTHLNYGSQTLLNDVYRPIFGEPKPGREVWLGRMLMLIIVILAVLVTISADSLMGITLIVVGLCGSSATFGWGQWWWYRVNLPAWITSVVTGPVFYVIFMYLLPLIPWWKEQQLNNPETMAILQAVLSMIMSTMSWMIVTLLTKPEDMEVLKEFYLRVRPCGYWRPVRQALIAEGRLQDEPQHYNILTGFGVAVVGFVMMAAGTLTIAALFVGDYLEVIIYAVIAIVIGLIFKRLFRWHLKRLGADIDTYIPIDVQ